MFLSRCSQSLDGPSVHFSEATVAFFSLHEILNSNVVNSSVSECSTTNLKGLVSHAAS